MEGAPGQIKRLETDSGHQRQSWSDEPCERCEAELQAGVEHWLALTPEQLAEYGLELRPVTDSDVGQPYHIFSLFRSDGQFAFVRTKK